MRSDDLCVRTAGTSIHRPRVVPTADTVHHTERLRHTRGMVDVRDTVEHQPIHLTLVRKFLARRAEVIANA